MTIRHLSILTLLVTLCASSAFANCSDAYVADCGEFKVLSSSCSRFDDEVQFFEIDEKWAATFNNQDIGTVPLTKKSAQNKVETLIAQVSTQKEVHVQVVYTRDLKGQARYTYLTYSVNQGRMSDLKQCSNLLP